MSFASIACPEADAAAKREAKRKTKAPWADTVDASGKAAVSVGRWKEKTDEFREAEARKNGVITRVIDDYEHCRGGGASQPTS